MSPLGKGYEGPGAHDIPGSFEGHPENIGEWPVAGPGEIGAGARDIARGDIARGGHRMISGAGNTLMPFAPFVATAAPLATARAVSGGYIGGRAAEAGAGALNLSPDQKALAGDVGNLVAGGIAAEPAPFVRTVGRAMTPSPRRAWRSLAQRMRNFGVESPPEAPNPFRDVSEPGPPDVFNVTEPTPAAEPPQRPGNVRYPGEIPREAIYPRAYPGRTAEPIPPRPGLALPPGPGAPPPVSAAGSLIETVRGWTPPEEFYPPFQRQQLRGFRDVQEDTGIEQDIANRIEHEGHRISTDESRRAWAANSPATPKSVLIEQMGGKVPEKAVNLKPYRPPLKERVQRTTDPQAVIKRLADTNRLATEENIRAAQQELSGQGEDLTSKPTGETPAATAKATSDYPRLVEKVKAAPRSRPKLIDEMKAQQPGPDEDLTPLLEKSLQDDARVKIKVAAEHFPVKFIAVTQNREGWHFEEF